MMNARFYSDRSFGSDNDNSYTRFVPRYVGGVYNGNTIDDILGKKCLAFSALCSSGKVSDPNAGAAEVVCNNFKKYEALHNELKRIAVTPTCSGYIVYTDTGLLFSELAERLNKLENTGLIKTFSLGIDRVYIEIVPAANSFLTRDFALIYTVSELRQKAFDVRYNCKLSDTHSGAALNIDIIYQTEPGGHADFVMIILNNRLTEYTNPNVEKHYKKIITAAERLRGLTLIVSPSINVVLLKQILANYTKHHIHIVKLDELYRLR